MGAGGLDQLCIGAGNGVGGLDHLWGWQSKGLLGLGSLGQVRMGWAAVR